MRARGAGGTTAEVKLGALVGHNFVTVGPGMAMFSVIRAIAVAGAEAAIVTADGTGAPVEGIITRGHVASAVGNTVQIYNGEER